MTRRFGTAALRFGPLVAITLACADQGVTAPPCGTVVTVTVSKGLYPTFSWASGCQIEQLTVARPASGAIVWSAVSPNRNSIAPPVQYAATPPGAAMTANRLEFLVAGTTYEVELFRIDDLGSRQSVGRSTFVP